MTWLLDNCLGLTTETVGARLTHDWLEVNLPFARSYIV